MENDDYTVGLLMKYVDNIMSPSVLCKHFFVREGISSNETQFNLEETDAFCLLFCLLLKSM